VQRPTDCPHEERSRAEQNRVFHRVARYTNSAAIMQPVKTTLITNSNAAFTSGLSPWSVESNHPRTRRKKFAATAERAVNFVRAVRHRRQLQCADP
jgi:hypothetical protein